MSKPLLFPIPRIGIFVFNSKTMAKNTSVLLGDHYEKFINDLVQSGTYSSASEVVRTALRLFEQEEQKRLALIQELIKGEKSGIAPKMVRKQFLLKMEKKHLKK